MNSSQRNVLQLHAAEHDEVVFADHESLVCDQQNPLLLIVPVVYPGRIITEKKSRWLDLSKAKRMAFTETSRLTQKMVRLDHSEEKGAEKYHLLSLNLSL